MCIRDSRFTDLAGCQMARVDPIVHHHPRIGAQFPIELSGADIHRVNARGARLQQHIGEAAGGGADVQACLLYTSRCV